MVKGQDSKISADRLVPAPVIVLPEGHPDLKYFNPNKVIVVPRGTTPSVAYVKASPYKPTSSAVAELGSLEGNEKDAPDLSDIVIVSGPTRKKRANTNDIYYEIVYKVRNSSLTPGDVIGVDARIVGTEPEND